MSLSASVKNDYTKTMYACFIGYIIQAIVNNFAPLLFLTFHTQYKIPLSDITLLVTVNFSIQLLVDLLSVRLVDKIGYRVSMILAHIFAAVGLISLTILPELFSDAFTGLLTAVALYAVGGGLLEVLISPIMEACPTDNKEKAMSLLHSFYCWGYVSVVLISTLFFAVFGISEWKILAIIWALVPIINGILFSQAPIASLTPEGEEGLSLKELFSSKLFWILMVMMVCAGASEQAVSQWASTFAEQGLGVGKTVGDLAGPMAFAILMGLSRLIYGKYGDKLNLDHFMLGSGILCIVSYLIISLVPNSVIALAGCALCGLSVGIMWPGTFSKASSAIKGGGTAMFALLALSGDLGCGGGPTVAGFVSGQFNDDLKKGIMAAIIFPVLLVLGLFVLKKTAKSGS